MTSPAESRVTLFRARREHLLTLPDRDLCDVAGRYLERRQFIDSLAVALTKIVAKCAAGIALKWGEKNALANAVALADAET